MQKEEGFSLLELLMVIAIVGIIAGIAVPSLLKARRTANAASAVQSLRTITTAEVLYERRYSAYGTLSSLAPEGTLDTNLSSGNKSGYWLTIVLSADLKHFSANADPQEMTAENMHYFVDESNVIRANYGAAATAASNPIQ